MATCSREGHSAADIAEAIQLEREHSEVDVSECTLTTQVGRSGAIFEKFNDVGRRALLRTLYGNCSFHFLPPSLLLLPLSSSLSPSLSLFLSLSLSLVISCFAVGVVVFILWQFAVGFLFTFSAVVVHRRTIRRAQGPVCPVLQRGPPTRAGKETSE